jgi:hypothetical protein
VEKYSFSFLIAKKGIYLRTKYYEAIHNKDYSVVKTFRAGELALFFVFYRLGFLGHADSEKLIVVLWFIQTCALWENMGFWLLISGLRADGRSLD